MKKTLVVGATPNPERYSYMATEMLRAYKHTAVAFGIRKGQIGSEPIVNQWPSEQDFDTVTLYLNPELQVQYIEPILNLKPKRVIFNPGTENPQFEARLRQEGIEPIEACTLVMLRTNQF